MNYANSLLSENMLIRNGGRMSCDLYNIINHSDTLRSLPLKDITFKAFYSRNQGSANWEELHTLVTAPMKQEMYLDFSMYLTSDFDRVLINIPFIPRIGDSMRGITSLVPYRDELDKYLQDEDIALYVREITHDFNDNYTMDTIIHLSSMEDNYYHKHFSPFNESRQ